MRKQTEIDAEIAALKALKPVGDFKEKTKRSIEVAIIELEEGFDDTSGEWDELEDTQQDIVNTARMWKEGDSSEKPSEGWGELVE